MEYLVLAGQQSVSVFKGFLLALALILLALFLIPVPAQAQVSTMATCESWYWNGDCCCGSVRCTKERERQCTASNGTTYMEHQCSFFTTCS